MAVNLSIVLPCYNEAASLEKLTDGYFRCLQDRQDCERVLVDNGSGDGTWELMEKLKAKVSLVPITLIKVPENKGYGYGLIQGLKAASGTFLSWSHADLQCPPEDVFKLYDAVMDCHDPKMVFGKGHRTNDRGSASILTRIQTILARVVLGYKMVEISAQPKLFHRSFFDLWQSPPRGYELDMYAYYHALRRGMEIVSIDVVFLDRQEGESKWAYSIKSRLATIFRNTLALFQLRFSR